MLRKNYPHHPHPQLEGAVFTSLHHGLCALNAICISSSTWKHILFVLCNSNIKKCILAFHRNEEAITVTMFGGMVLSLDKPTINLLMMVPVQSCVVKDRQRKYLVLSQKQGMYSKSTNYSIRLDWCLGLLMYIRKKLWDLLHLYLGISVAIEKTVLFSRLRNLSVVYQIKCCIKVKN